MAISPSKPSVDTPRDYSWFTKHNAKAKKPPQSWAQTPKRDLTDRNPWGDHAA